jgi:hypothetical protein
LLYFVEYGELDWIRRKRSNIFNKLSDLENGNSKGSHFKNNENGGLE